MEKFQCKKCGLCCKTYGVTEGEKFLSIYEWEIETFKKCAKEKRIIINIKPVVLFFDTKHKLLFATGYGLFQTPCPFLVNNRCSIYEKRPLSCKLFPMRAYPLTLNKILKNDVLDSSCPNYNANKFLKSIQDLDPDIKVNVCKSVFGPCCDSAYQVESICLFIECKLSKIKDHIQLVIMDGCIDSYEILPFFEYLIKIGNITIKEKDKLYSKFKNF